MHIEKISANQMFCLMVLFQLGSAIVVGVGLDAKQDAWLAILLGMAGGCCLYGIYYLLFQYYPELPLTSYIPLIIGKWIGIPLAAGYIMYFFYISARVLRDFAELIMTASLNETPIFAITGLMMLVVMYAAYGGGEVIARTSELIFVIMISFMLIGIVLLLLSGKVEGSRLMPVLEEGWKPLAKTFLTQTYTFPFGEMIVFNMLLNNLNNKRLVLRTGLYAILFAGLLLAVTIAMDIMVLGADEAGRSFFPLLETFSKVNIGQFIHRLDILVISMLILGMFVKIAVFFYAGLIGVSRLLVPTNNKVKRILPLIAALIVLVSSITIAGSFNEHIFVGLKWVPVHMHLPLQTLVPLLLLLVVSIRERLKPRRGKGAIS